MCSENPIIHALPPSLRSFPSVVFETVPRFVSFTDTPPLLQVRAHKLCRQSCFDSVFFWAMGSSLRK